MNKKKKRGPFGALPETKMCFAVVVVHKFFKPPSPRPGHHSEFLFCCLELKPWWLTLSFCYFYFFSVVSRTSLAAVSITDSVERVCVIALADQSVGWIVGPSVCLTVCVDQAAF